jgi:hypothetical protein
MATGANAVISPDGRYRYLLTRRVSAARDTVTFIMLNPSTADATLDDPTIRRCIGFSRRWRCGVLQVVNLFAFRTSDPGCLKTVADPVGPENLRWILRSVDRAEHSRVRPIVVCAWGVHGRHRNQDLAILRLLKRRTIRLVALGRTKDGHPRHPLYAPYSSRRILFGPP